MELYVGRLNLNFVLYYRKRNAFFFFGLCSVRGGQEIKSGINYMYMYLHVAPWPQDRASDINIFLNNYNNITISKHCEL